MSKSISQREARRFRKRVQQLEELIAVERRAYGAEYPSGEWIAQIDISNFPEICGRLATVRLLRHALVAVMQSDKNVAFYALPHPKLPA